jgi:hypothetical protein
LYKIFFEQWAADDEYFISIVVNLFRRGPLEYSDDDDDMYKVSTIKINMRSAHVVGGKKINIQHILYIRRLEEKNKRILFSLQGYYIHRSSTKTCGINCHDLMTSICIYTNM